MQAFLRCRGFAVLLHAPHMTDCTPLDDDGELAAHASASLLVGVGCCWATCIGSAHDTVEQKILVGEQATKQSRFASYASMVPNEFPHSRIPASRRFQGGLMTLQSSATT